MGKAKEGKKGREGLVDQAKELRLPCRKSGASEEFWTGSD